MTVDVECLAFGLGDDATCAAAGGGGCEERFAVSAIVEPARLGELCPDQTSLNATTGTVTLALDVDVHVGHGEAPHSSLAASRHAVVFKHNVRDSFVLSANTAAEAAQTEEDSLVLGVAARRVALASDADAPCDPDEIADADSDGVPDTDMSANGRVCVVVDTTGDDEDDYVAFLQNATIQNLATGSAVELVAGRHFNETAIHAS